MSTPIVRALAVAVTGAALALGASPQPAAAAPPERESFESAYEVVVEDYCGSAGLTVLHEVVLDGRFQVGQRGRDGLSYFLDHLRTDEVLTNVATGAQVRITSNTGGKDVHVTDNGDGTITVLFMVAGTTTVSDAEGKALARNPGQGRLQFLLDHGGTPRDKTDDVFLEPPTVVKESTGRDDDLCAAAVDALT